MGRVSRQDSHKRAGSTVGGWADWHVIEGLPGWRDRVWRKSIRCQIGFDRLYLCILMAVSAPPSACHSEMNSTGFWSWRPPEHGNAILKADQQTRSPAVLNVD